MNQFENSLLRSTHMIGRIQIVIILLCSFSLNGVYAQSGLFGGPVAPLKPQSPLFGKDIVINDQPTQNQRQVVIRSAFNGWLFAEYSYTDQATQAPASTVMKSVDNGITWTVFFNGVWPGAYHSFASVDMAVTGDSLSNLKVFLAWVASNSPSGYHGDGSIWRFNGETGDYEDGILIYSTYYIALFNDFMYPASNSNPYSLGVLYSAENLNFTMDSIVFLSSNNGGMSFNSRQVVATTTGNHFNKVALAYGRSPSWNSGRYFAAWEEKSSYTSNTGHIYTAHSNPDFNGTFTTPVKLDSVDASAYGNARNPAIACQYNNVDNDSSNLTEVVLFDKYNPSNQSYDIEGFYNLQATNHSNFQRLIISNSAHNNFQPSINFNPFDSTFMVTYYDSTTQKLPFLLNNFNLANPDSWQWITTGYNDDSNLAAPYPKVVLDLGQERGANVWAKEGTGGNGVAMFDAPYSTWTGISENNKIDDSQLFWVYPNPCNTNTTIRFELRRPEKVTITICNFVGQPAGIITDQSYQAGKHEVKCNISNLSPGSYIVKFKAGDFQTAGKLTVIR